jgi:putative NIF3 family GTP cyclohydrolase 1 type 2
VANTRVSDLLDYMRRTADWVDWDDTVDGVIVGSLDAEVSRAAVAWIPDSVSLRRAVEMGCELFITHEPTLYSHGGELEHAGEWPGAEEKRRYIEHSGLTVLRCHDTWDRMPEVGIPWAWAGFLELGEEPVESRPFLNVYRVDQTTLEELAQRVADRTTLLGEPRVQVAGDPALEVNRLGVGTGCFCDPRAYREMGADAGLVCDDGTAYWREIQWAVDHGFGIIRVNHGTSEEPGVRAMCEHFAEQFPGVTFRHLSQGCRFRLVGPEG